MNTEQPDFTLKINSYAMEVNPNSIIYVTLSLEGIYND